MEVTVDRTSLKSALALVQGVVERRTTMPILSNVLIQAEGDRLRLAATDLEIGIRTELVAEVNHEGLVTASARKLWEIVQEAGADEIILSASNNEHVEVRCGRALFKMTSLDPKSFPAMPTAGVDSQASDKERSHLMLKASVLAQMIDRVLFAASQDESRYTLNGVHIESPDSGKLRMVATDGHRLALIEREVSGMRLTRGAILPRKGVAEIERLLKLKEQDGEVELIVEPRLAWIKAGNTQVSMRLVEGEFPDYQAVIPKSSRYEVVVSRDLLEAAIKRAAIFSNERFHGVKLELSGQTLTVSSITPGLGEAKDVIDVEFSGNDFTVGFNASYLLQVLAALPQGCSITIGLTDEVSPGVITTPTDSSYTYVVMPMRL